jgi:hypothetical protein
MAMGLFPDLICFIVPSFVQIALSHFEFHGYFELLDSQIGISE